MLMKKLFKSVLLLAVSAVAISACQKEISIDETTPEGDYIYNFAINNADNTDADNANAVDTKATLGSDGTTLYLEWEDGDTFGAYATNGSNNSTNRPSTVSVSGSSYILKVASTVALESGSSVYTYFPYNSGAGSKTAAVIKIDPVQAQKSTGFNASVMPMVGEVYTTETELAEDQETEVGAIKFANLGAIIEFNIYATSAIDEQIKSVEFNSTSGNLAGNFTLDLTAVDFSDENTLKLSGEGTEQSVKTNLDTPVAIPVSTTSEKAGTKVYMSIAPGDYAGSIVVTTTVHTYTFNVSSAKTFNRSKVKRLNANLSTAVPGELAPEENWEVITSASDFTAGTYVIVSSDKSSYLVNEAKNQNPASGTAHWDGSGKLTGVTDDAKWIATASGSGLQFASYANTENYLWQSTSKAQGVSVAASAGSASIVDQAKIWTLVANSTLGGDSGYIATTGGNRYLALYTNGTWRGYTITASGDGAGYFNGNADIKAAIFYKLADSRTTLDTPVLTVNGTVVSWASITNADSYLVTIGSDEYTINATSVDLADYSLSDGEYTVSVVAVPSNTTQYKNSAAATTTITIGNPSGTSTNPYTVAEALTAAGKLDTGGQSVDEVYIRGIVSTVSSYNSTYKSITYYISDDGTTTNQFEVYSGKGLEGADFSAITDLAVGDEVTVKGYLKNYNETLEVYQNNQIVAINYATRYTITVNSATNGTITASAARAGAQGLITLKATPNSGYELDKWSVKDASDNDVTVTNNQFTMPASNVTVSASFKTASGKTYTILWNSTNNSKGISSYTDTWTVTSNGLTCNMAYWNNYNNGWTNSSGNGQIKCGRKNIASVATIITSTALSEAIKTVTITIDALTQSKINSIKLYSSSDNSSWTEEGSFTKSTGDQSVTISSPTSNKYYKLEFDCASGSSNGLLTLSKLVLTTN